VEKTSKWRWIVGANPLVPASQLLIRLFWDAHWPKTIQPKYSRPNRPLNVWFPMIPLFSLLSSYTYHDWSTGKAIYYSTGSCKWSSVSNWLSISTKFKFQMILWMATVWKDRLGQKKDQWGGKIDLARKSFTFLTSFMDIFGSSNNPNPYIPIYTYCSIHCTRTPICNINLGLVYC